MRFAEAFGIEDPDRYGWFNRHLTVDTKLFLDPALFLRAGNPWPNTHQELLDHFTACYPLLARSPHVGSAYGRAAIRLLTFPEPREYGLGYTAEGTDGAGAGVGAARVMAGGILAALSHGVRQPSHIEELGVLCERIGADKISDAACNVLRARFIEYTQRSCRTLGVQMHVHRVNRVHVDTSSGDWTPADVALPTNPSDGKPIILVPKKLLRDLPALNWESFIDNPSNTDLRDSLNLKINENVRKSDVVRIARQNAGRLQEWANEEAADGKFGPYDMKRDPLGQVQWDFLPRRFAQQNPLTVQAPTNRQEFSALIAEILRQYRRFIEEQGGWGLLWNDDGTEKPEEAAQLALLGLAQPYLRAMGVELDREVELGRGPVDFKASSGSRLRVLIELKKLHGHFWTGVEQQLPSYLKSDDGYEAWFVSIRYRSGKKWDAREKDLQTRVRRVEQENKIKMGCILIDARRPVSASKVRPDTPK